MRTVIAIATKRKKGLIIFAGTSVIVFAISLAVAVFRSGGAHIWITDSWMIHSKENPVLYAALCMIGYFWIPVLGISLGVCLIGVLFRKKAAFIAVAVLIFALTGVFAYFSIAGLDDPLGKDLSDFAGILGLCVFLTAAGVGLIIGHFRSLRAKNGAGIAPGN